MPTCTDTTEILCTHLSWSHRGVASPNYYKELLANLSHSRQKTQNKNFFGFHEQ
jgi:hypothetical protein